MKAPTLEEFLGDYVLDNTARILGAPFFATVWAGVPYPGGFTVHQVSVQESLVGRAPWARPIFRPPPQGVAIMDGRRVLASIHANFLFTDPDYTRRGLGADVAALYYAGRPERWQNRPPARIYTTGALATLTRAHEILVELDAFGD